MGWAEGLPSDAAPGWPIVGLNPSSRHFLAPSRGDRLGASGLYGVTMSQRQDSTGPPSQCLAARDLLAPSYTKDRWTQNTEDTRHTDSQHGRHTAYRHRTRQTHTFTTQKTHGTWTQNTEDMAHTTWKTQHMDTEHVKHMGHGLTIQNTWHMH